MPPYMNPKTPPGVSKNRQIRDLDAPRNRQLQEQFSFLARRALKQGLPLGTQPKLRNKTTGRDSTVECANIKNDRSVSS